MDFLKLSVSTVIVAVLVLLAGCQSAEQRVAAMTAIEQMEIAFVGGYSQSDIKRSLDEAMRLYGTPISEANYSRAGSVLIVLRREYGSSEMEILDYLIRSYVPGVNMDFPEMAAFAAVFLAAGDK